MKRMLIAAALLSLIGLSPALADEKADQAARWHFIAAALFGNHVWDDGAAVMDLKAPDSSMDASLVPITIELNGAQPVAMVSLVIDNNPSPLVGTFHLGPAFAPQQLKMRVRVNDFTMIHAVAETADGKFYEVSKYIKAAGGCSAPSADQSPDIIARIGKMQLRRDRMLDANLVGAQLLISHPNFNGIQRDPVSGKYTPARYLEYVSVSVGGVKAFDLNSGISMSEDPAISFIYRKTGDGSVDVTAKDSSSAVFTRHFGSIDQVGRTLGDN